jgi:site-specific recombinase
MSAGPGAATATTSGAALRDALFALLPDKERRRRRVRELSQVLVAFVDAPTVGERLDAWIGIVGWTRRGGLPRPSDKPPDTLLPRHTQRLRFLLSLFESSPATREALLVGMARLLAETEGAGFFGEAGLPSQRGFFSELGDRFMRRVLPAPRDDRDLSRILGELFPTDAHVERFRRLPPEIFHRVVTLLAPPDRPEIWAPVRAAFADGLRLLAARAKAEGLSGKIRARSKTTVVSASPFYRLGRATDAVVDVWLAGGDLAGPAREWRELATACWIEMATVRRRLEREGVSVDIVYALDVIDRSLKRMEAMLEILEAPDGERRSAAIQRLLTRLALLHRKDQSVLALAGTNLQMLARRIVERSGQTGEHYIAADRKQYWHLWLAAAGGGALTVVTAAVKMKVVGKGIPAFPEGILSGLNYAVSFLLLQAFGFVLATKQPAMTAATLASILRERRGVHRLDEIVGFTASIVRSQVAAAIGNVTVVAAGAWLFDHLFRRLAGRPYLDPADARYVFETLSPLDSLTVLYAAETGVLLWLASVCGGWFENWAVYHRLPRAIAAHPLGKHLGQARLRKFADAIERNASGWGTNISLGFLLGMTPSIGRFLGLPLDVRHVTLSTGTLALAAESIDYQWFGHGGILRGVSGIAVMFVLNLSVSFGLSLASAARAYGLPLADLAELLGRLGRRFLRSPGEFLLPPPKSASGAEAPAHG